MQRRHVIVSLRSDMSFERQDNRLGLRVMSLLCLGQNLIGQLLSGINPFGVDQIFEERLLGKERVADVGNGASDPESIVEIR